MMDLELHVVNALPPVADAFAASADTDIIKANGDGVLFVIHEGVASGAGVSTVTVEACDNVTPSNSTAVPFIYRECVSGDTWGAWTAAAAAGFTATMTVSNSMWQIYVDAAELAEEGYEYVRLSTTETGNFPILAGVLALVVNPRYQVQPATMIT